MDKFSKTHPWRVTLHRQAGFNAPGEKMCRTKGGAESFVTWARQEHGADVCSDVYKTS